MKLLKLMLLMVRLLKVDDFGILKDSVNDGETFKKMLRMVIF